VGDCVFCEIVAGRVGAHRLVEDEHTVAFLNLAPATVGHALGVAGVNLVHATGAAAWQSVFHFHLHVVPRYRADELRPMWEAERVPDAELAAVRARVLGKSGVEVSRIARAISSDACVPRDERRD
jgi:histidine triad (HIT) family protein